MVMGSWSGEGPIDDYLIGRPWGGKSRPDKNPLTPMEHPFRFGKLFSKVGHNDDIEP
jgi:hypothetical protein